MTIILKTPRGRRLLQEDSEPRWEFVDKVEEWAMRRLLLQVDRMRLLAGMGTAQQSKRIWHSGADGGVAVTTDHPGVERVILNDDSLYVA